MDKARLLLILTTLAIAIGPIAGVLIIHQNNLVDAVMPSDLVEAISDPFASETPFEPPTLVDSQYDSTSRTTTLTFNFTNPLNLDLTINSMFSDLECTIHKKPLGNSSLTESVSILAGANAFLTVSGTWTEEAINHFQTEHKDAKTTSIDLVRLKLSVKGINLELNDRITIPNVPITQG